MSLQSKHALITGSSRGIGRGIALKLAESGVKVAIHYYTNEAAATDTLTKVRKHGSDGFIVQADVSRPEDIRRMFGRRRLDYGPGYRRGRWVLPYGHGLPAGHPAGLTTVRTATTI